MLTEIKQGINIPFGTEVVAVNKYGGVLVGILKSRKTSISCIYENIELVDVTHFITVENLLKLK